MVIATYNTVNHIYYVKRGLPKAAPTDLIRSAYNIQCAVSDVQVTVLIIVSELASDNVVRQRGLRAHHMNSTSGAFTMFISGSG